MESTSNYDIIRHLHGLDLVKLMLGKRDQMEALAEEAAELSWAALKWIRATGMSANPTSEDFHTTANNLIEEFNDVLACAYVAGLRIPTEDELKQSAKSKRWEEKIRAEYERRMQEVRRKEHETI